ncbi:hypothetical protein [Microbacterium invictum]|uniref:Uncharacterized protein n=1 Tax=Microbacterium invictum TaxID=515415 RepID=A0AA40SPI8_9MICO|nr:hypothetical protein [Microbacterium invictum]MBB4140053.1 hypothetical protein [Microbacterium invictum]
MSKKRKRPSVNPAKRTGTFTERVVLRDYEAWLRRSDPSADDDDIDDALTTLEELVALAGAHRIDLLDPRSVERMCAVIGDDAHVGDPLGLIEALDAYIHFRLETETDTALWDAAHGIVADELDELDELMGGFGGAEVIARAATASAALPVEQRRQALADLPLIAGVRGLLEWMGTSKPITDTGALRRADIEPVAAMIGLNAVGVAKRTGRWTESAPVQVSTMWELAPLGAWWEVLQIAGIVHVTASRVRPGPAAAEWLADDLPPLESAEKVAGLYLSEKLTNVLRAGDGPRGEEIFARSIDLVVDALDGVIDPSPPEDRYEEFLDLLARRPLVELADRGLLTSTRPHEFAVPEERAGVVAHGLTVAMTMAGVLTHDDDDETEFASADFEDEDDDEFDDPFADPEVRAEMARLGIVHKPGMAQQMLEELAPLLAEDGIDLDNLEEGDLDRFNDALERAQERHNLELFTPVGAARERAIIVLRLLSEALAEGSDAVAQVVLEGIPSDPEADRPSVAQVIGVGLGFLDGWHGASAFGAGVARARLADGNPAGQAAARDILAAAGKGHAFGSLRELIGTHAGKAVLHGTALAVSASVAVRAARDGADLRETAEQMLPI